MKAVARGLIADVTTRLCGDTCDNSHPRVSTDSIPTQLMENSIAVSDGGFTDCLFPILPNWTFGNMMFPKQLINQLNQQWIVSQLSDQLLLQCIVVNVHLLFRKHVNTLVLNHIALTS